MTLKRLSQYLFLLAPLLLAACAPATTPAAETVKAFYAALNTKDIDRAAAFIAADAIFANPTGKYLGKAEIVDSLRSQATDGLTFDLSNFRESQGRVSYDYQVRLGSELLDSGTNGLTIVENGQVVFDGTELTQLTDSRSVEFVKGYYAALNAKDIDRAMAFIAPGAVFANPTGKYTTTAEIRASLEGLARDGFTFELSNFREKDGRVVYDYKVKLGEEVLDVGTDGLTIVKDGLIVFDGTERTE